MLVGGGDGNNTGFENVDHYAACGIAGGYDRIRLACYTALIEPHSCILLLYSLRCNISYTLIVAICNSPCTVILDTLQ